MNGRNRSKRVKWIWITVITCVLVGWNIAGIADQVLEPTALQISKSAANKAIPPETDQGWYFKPGYQDYAINGMPDFDQRQDNWFDPTNMHWTYCGPVAVGNCLWWFDSKFEPSPVSPPTVNDGYPLVYTWGSWDDHDTLNVEPTISQIATMMGTGPNGTTPNQLLNGVIAYLSSVGLLGSYTVDLLPQPPPELICAEVFRSQDVILLLGFWEDLGPGEYTRVGGHYVTVAGIDTTCSEIAFSDPWFDWAEQGYPVRVGDGILILHPPAPHAPEVHNDAGNISHDGYIIAQPSPSPGGIWWLPDYPIMFNPDALLNFEYQNCPDEFLTSQAPWQGGNVHTEVEYALIICPVDQEEMDFGDAPDPSYPSLLVNDGARHADPSFEWLGDSVDVEFDANIVDLDNYDDGVIFYPPYTPGNVGQVDLIVSVSDAHSGRYNANALIYLHGWFDWMDDGDWDDAGENVFCGVTVDPSTWPAGQTQETITISFNVPAGISVPDTFWTRFRLDYAQNLNSYTGMADFGEVEDHLFTDEEPPEFYFKPGYPDYAPSGMPDFDQHQDEWYEPGANPIWTYCGPVALANCLWWFDSKFEPDTIPPPTISDGYDLVRRYGVWDDHDTSNVEPFVDDLANYVNTGSNGTEVHDLYDGALNYINDQGLSAYYSVRLWQMPEMDSVFAEVHRSQDVILLLGFWEYSGPGEYQRVGGHYVTVAGVDYDYTNIAFSDPFFNQAEMGNPVRVLSGSLIPHTPIPGHGPTVHNDAGNISHDGYQILGSSPSPGGSWGIIDYPVIYEPDALLNFIGQNCPNELLPSQGPYGGGAIFVEVEYALIICPAEPEEYDFGDAPDPTFPSLAISNGARHADFSQEWMGQSVDGEFDANITDLDNFDDGVILYPPYSPGGIGGLEIIVTATNPHGGRYSSTTPIYLHGWIDFNADGDWVDPGENVLCGGMAVPSTWGATQTQDTMTILFTVPTDVAYGDTIWARFRLDYNQNLNSEVGIADYGEVEDYWFVQEEEVPELYFKPGYPDYAPNGMPDFDQRQDEWYNSASGQWTYCGPVAVSNCLWWFDSKFEPDTIPPPTISDGYDLVHRYGSWDDHDTLNVMPLIDTMAVYVNTGGGGTEVHDLFNGVNDYIDDQGLSGYYSVRLWRLPQLDSVFAEVLLSQDVILLLGFWENTGPNEYCRVGGHYVTVAGVDSQHTWIAFSDPYLNRAENGHPVRVLNGSLIPHTPIPGHPASVHNDAGNISHDGYQVVAASPSPGGVWGIQNYPASVNIAVLQNFYELNCPNEWLSWQCPYQGGEINVEVEYALIICPDQPDELDFGDAPDPTYRSLQASNGARHADPSFEWLGDSVDVEMDANITDLDLYDDGVIFYPPYTPGTGGQVDLIVSAANPFGGRYAGTMLIYLHGWFDWNGDGDWWDAGENVFCGVTVNPSTWSAGQTQDTIGITISVPTGIPFPDSIWTRFRLDYMENLNSVIGLAEYGEVEDHLLIQQEEPPELYYKPGYPDYAPNGMPDFDQRQDGWYNLASRWTYCGPVALGNCLWWFDSKFEPDTIPPPTISDGYGLVTRYGLWDDHDTANVVPFISDLGNYVNVGSNGTIPLDLYQGALNYIDSAGLSWDYNVTLVPMPTLSRVCQEVLISQDVILLLGFWEDYGNNEYGRIGGHYVTVAGIDSNCGYVALSDPFLNRAESGFPGRVLNGILVPHTPIPGHSPPVHNDAGNISHDIYQALTGSVSPGGNWWLPDYDAINDPIVRQNFVYQNCPPEWVSWQATYQGGPIRTEVEYALIICPVEHHEFDYGDAPDPTFPSLLASNGARHIDFSYEWMGDSVNGEPDANITDLDMFDDGVIFYPPYISGGTGQVDIIVSVSDAQSGRYGSNNLIYLHGWMDLNGDGDWADGGENIFCSVSVDPSTWPAGQNRDTVSIAFTLPVTYAIEDTFWSRFRLDYMESMNLYTGAAEFGEVEDYLVINEEPPPEFYFKPGYPDYAPSGIPDFDQKQNGWFNPTNGRWNHCGPVALANCLWWFDSKFEPDTIPPPTISDGYNLVTRYGLWDDHDTSNVIPFVSDLAGYVNTGATGTNIIDMYNGALTYINDAGLSAYYDVNLYNMVSWEFVCDEVLRSQNVILLLGFWESTGSNEWQRVGGHYVTMAGVDTSCTWVAFSDPFFDRAEEGYPVRVLGHIPIPGGHLSWVHNDASCVSHDGFLVMRGSPSPGGAWWLPTYANQLEYDDIENFAFQNCPSEFQSMQGNWTGGAIHVEVEYALVICPDEPDEFDFGDAPDPNYPSLMASMGARHVDFSYEWMGDSVDGELDANIVDLDNYDDGVTFDIPNISGAVGRCYVIVSVSNAASPRYSPDTPIYLHGWIDWNADEDWDDAGENIFCGFTVDPSTWPAGQNRDTVTIGFTIPHGSIAYGDTLWARVRLDYNQNLNSVTGPAYYGEVEDYWMIVECLEPPEEGWYYKPGYPDYCNFGIPDFDQKQDSLGVTTVTGWKWTHCGPVALANCMWWFDSKFEYWTNPTSPPPPTISNSFPLVPQFGAWDDHDPQNVQPLIENLASFASTNSALGLGTDIDSLASAFQQVLQLSGLDALDVFTYRVVQQPTFLEVYSEVIRSQDVILLLGFWGTNPAGDWCRYGGHYVTTAGVWQEISDQGYLAWIAVSDPFYDEAEGGPPPPHGPTVHNDADSISGPHGTNWHDRYPVVLNCPSPGGIWGLDCYPLDWNYIKNFYRQNFTYDLLPWMCTDSLMISTNVEVEYALIICPSREYEDLDFGDAPDPTYPSLLASDGARHFDYSHEWLGEAVEGELESDQVDADMFDDGVIFLTQYIPGNIGTVRLTVSVADPTDARYDTANIYLHGWFDFNLDGDWDDADENVFCGIVVDPNTWPAGQYSENVDISFTVPNTAAVSDTFWTRFRLDYAENMNSVTGLAQYGEVEDHLLVQEMPHGFYFKPQYPNYAPQGMPDFDQHQDNWRHSLTGAWTFCGPVAVANCLWWFDSKFDTAGAPGDGYDLCPIVRDYLDNLPPTPGLLQDDHCYNNVNDTATVWPPAGPPPVMPPFTPGYQNPPILSDPWGELVERLAWVFDTDGIRTSTMHYGTNVFTMQDAIDTLLVRINYDSLLYEHTIPQPSLDTIRVEVRKCQDVILLLGFWEFQEAVPPQWVRIGGHFVTVAGVDTIWDWIAVSDPAFDNALAGGPGHVTTGHPPIGSYGPAFHNNARWVSHDYYEVLSGSPSPGGEWYLPEYPVTLDPYLVNEFYAQNDPDPTGTPPDWQGGPIHTEIEYAVTISPIVYEIPLVITMDNTYTYIELVWDILPTAQGYKIYRSTDPYFTPSPATYMATVDKWEGWWRDPTIDLNLITSERYFYRMIVIY